MSNKRSLRVRSTKRFERTYKKYVGKDKIRRTNVDETLRLLANNMNDPRLKTHALTGELAGAYACACGYDCRIVFTVETNTENRSQEILLVSVGTHDQVY